ncbi:MAG: hypothetical protein ACJ8C4_20625 [Gemmataceae bacterium]
MPELTIELRCDPDTGRRDIVVKLHDDEELLPHEHEQLHRRLVNRLVEGGLLQAGEAGELVVEREGDPGASQPGQSMPDDRRAASEGQ